ncbi:hypothetical protein PYW07_000674 [Mythimna separata]|uniref:Reverse transcriptase domain-containing protein n=1 Tax=Mythimna separata TaxID=271217 RepID=A0AAD7Z203_MYTSE|nr:hypothetical protein PYW07_000674 [Mythimna separata]
MIYLFIAAWNINGIAPNTNELEVFLKEHKIDICLISETHTTVRSEIRIPGFCVYHTPHPSGGSHGGSAVVIKNNIKHYLLEPFATEHLQGTTVRVEDPSGPFNISAVYCPPRHNINEDMFSEYFETLGNTFIAGGDWNAKHNNWGSRITLTRGRELKKSMDAKRMSSLSTGEPTYWPTDRNKLPDLVDFFVTKNVCHKFTQIESCLDGSSDHTPIILRLCKTAIHYEPNDVLYNYKTDWDNFREYVEDKIDLNLPLKSPEDVDNACLYITNLIQVAAWNSTPELKRLANSSLTPIEVRRKIAEKRRLRRIWQTSRNEQDKTLLNRAIKELKEILANVKNEETQQRLERMAPNANGIHSLWKATKHLPSPQQCFPPIRSGNSWARSDQEKTDTFATHLANVFKPNESCVPEDPEIDNILNQDLQLCLPLRPTSPRELSRLIFTMNSNKAPGFDLITPKILKELPRKGLVFLTTLINASLRTSYVPALWKISQIVMIHKPGKPANEASSYRPISLTPVLSKLWEKVILNRLKPHLLENRTIPDHQFGFREQHSTIEQVHRVYRTIRQCMENKEYCSAAFLDVQQAFDRVWHKGLLCKIKQLLPHSFYLLMKSYLSDRYFQVKLRDARSSLVACLAGVPQGSVLGPVLYNIFTSDLPQCLDVSVATFADDAAFLACSKDPIKASSVLQEQLDQTHDWLNKWRIRASAPKSNHITFTLRRGDCPLVNLGPDALPQSSCVKYLGFYLDRRLTWKDHLRTKRTEINYRFKNLLWLLGRQSALSLSNKLRVYCSIIKPIWTYGIQLWTSASKSNIMCIQRAQNNILRVIAAAPWYTRNSEIHEYLEIPIILEETKRYLNRYKERLKSHPNPLSHSLLVQNHSKRLKKADIVLPD